MELNYEFSLEDGVAIEKHRLRRLFFFKPYGLLLAPALALLVRLFHPMTVTSYVNGVEKTEIGNFWIDFIINSLTFLLLILFARYLYMHRIKGLLMKNTSWKGHRRLELTEQRIIKYSDGIKTEIDLKVIQSIDEGKDHVYLNLDKYNIIPIPKRAWAAHDDIAAAISSFKTKILNHGKRQP